jgi:hypothetical protein
LLNSDSHAPVDLLTERFARSVLRGAAVPEADLPTVLVANPLALLERVGRPTL